MTAGDRPRPSPARLRRTAGDRRAQLVQIGLELLPTTPVQELTIDEVARRAGISRSLLFHYFATKRDYYTAVTRRGRRPALGAPAAPPGHAAGGAGHRDARPLRGLGGDLPRDAPGVRARRRRRRPVGGRGLRGDPRPAGRRGARGARLPDDALRRQLVLAWFAFTEDLVGQWTREPSDDPRRSC